MPRETHRGVHVLVVWLLQLVAGAASAAAHRGDAGHGLARAAPAVQSRYVGFAATGTCVCRPHHMHNKYCNFSDALGRNDPSNYDCRNYSNIAEMAQVSVVKFGDEANRTVPCALLGDNADPNHDLCTFHGGWPTSGLLRQLPGRRVLWLDFAASFAGRNGSISAHPKDLVVLGNASACPNDQNSIFTGIWWDHGAAAVAAQAELFFPALYAAGGRVDQLVLDFELSMLTPTACKPPYAGGAPGVPKTTANQLSVQACRACIEEKWRAIQNDHRFAAQDLPKLQEMGLQVARPYNSVSTLRPARVSTQSIRVLRHNRFEPDGAQSHFPVAHNLVQCTGFGAVYCTYIFASITMSGAGRPIQEGLPSVCDDAMAVYCGTVASCDDVVRERPAQ